MVSEQEFLITKALKKYNSQYSKNLKVQDFSIVSIPTRVNFHRSYQITSLRDDDYLKLHMHLLFDSIDDLRDYRIEVEKPFETMALGDEVYVACGFIDRYWYDSGTYKFNAVSGSAELTGALKLEGIGYILLEQGSYILPETPLTPV